jgi:hypothetical protein
VFTKAFRLPTACAYKDLSGLIIGDDIDEACYKERAGMLSRRQLNMSKGDCNNYEPNV